MTPIFNDPPGRRKLIVGRFRARLAGLALLGLFQVTSYAHPASGIVVDHQGNVFFIYSSHGVCKADDQGKLTYIHRTRGGHWMCFDPEGSFSRAQPRYFERISPDGVKPALIFADGGSPIAVLPGRRPLLCKWH